MSAARQTQRLKSVTKEEILKTIRKNFKQAPKEVMAIDKILPGRLDADSDERLLENGFMSDAMNITLSEDGKGTASIAKNMKGTVKADPLNDSDNPVNNRRVRGVGSVGDPPERLLCTSWLLTMTNQAKSTLSTSTTLPQISTDS